MAKINLIKRLRESLGISKKDFSKFLNISYVYLYYLENNQRYPSRKLCFKIKKFAKKFNIDVSLERLLKTMDLKDET